jgi:seryl-tRNA synthetase
MIRGVQSIQNNIEGLRTSLERRGIDMTLVDTFELLRNQQVATLQELENTRREKNEKNPKGIPDEETKVALKELSEKEKEYASKLDDIETKLQEIVNKLPNLVSETSPIGGEEDFVEIRRWGEIPTIENPKDHEELGKYLDIIDFDAGTKVAGAKFYYLKNEAAWLEFALIMYVMDLLRTEGFILMTTPQMVKNEVLEGIGFAPKGPEKQVYGIDEGDMSLIGTAEISLGGYHKDEIIDANRLPLKYLGFSTCFRTEAGAYGRHSKGLYRVHQFDKLEMFVFCLPEDSERIHQYLLEMEEKIFQGLGIPYRVIDIATGDLGSPAYKKYDIEAWMPGRGDFGEVTSTSNTTNYQSIRLNVRYSKEDQNDYVHTLNGTAIAISRALIAILENYQQADGSVLVPEVLQKYTGFSKIEAKG